MGISFGKSHQENRMCSTGLGVADDPARNWAHIEEVC